MGRTKVLREGMVEEKQPKVTLFTKQELYSAARYRLHRDLIQALLCDERKYSFEEADKIVNDFLKGKVK